MVVFLPGEAAGKLKVGDEARISLDAFGQAVFPATVSFVSPEAQFTPKFVETASQREKLVYRVKLKLPVSTAKTYEGQLKAGSTGNGFVRTDSTKPWPSRLSLSAEGTPAP